MPGAPPMPSHVILIPSSWAEVGGDIIILILQMRKQRLGDVAICPITTLRRWGSKTNCLTAKPTPFPCPVFPLPKALVFQDRGHRIPTDSLFLRSPEWES